MKKVLMLLIFNFFVVNSVLQSAEAVSREVDWRFFDAARRGCLDDMQKALDDGANVNVTELLQFKGTPLIDAAYRGHTEVIKKLIGAGADLDLFDAYKKTALIAAIDSLYSDITDVIILIDAGADVNVARGGVDNTALMHAFRRGNKKIIQKLIDAGADLENSLLSRFSMLQLIVNKAANFQPALFPKNWKLLNLASSFSYQEGVEVLLKNGACASDSWDSAEKNILNAMVAIINQNNQKKAEALSQLMILTGSVVPVTNVLKELLDVEYQLYPTIEEIEKRKKLNQLVEEGPDGQIFWFTKICSLQ